MKNLILSTLATCVLASSVPAQSEIFTLTSEYWTSERFLDRFMGTYGVIEDIEPDITEEEAAVFQTLVPLLQQGQIEAAIQQLATAITPESSAALDFTLGNLFFEKGQANRALSYYQNALRKFPNFVRVHKNIAFVHVRGEAWDKAVPALLKSIELGQEDSDTYGLLAFAYLMEKKYASAESAYKNALTLDPESVDWRNGLIRVLIESGQFDRGILLLDEAILKTPEVADYWLMQTDAFVSSGQTDKAIANLEMIKRLGFATGATMELLGKIYLREGLPTSAFEAFTASIESNDPLGTDAYLGLAETFVLLGNFEEAEKFLEEIEEEAELSNKEQITFLGIKGEMLINSGRAEEASEILNQLISRDPNNADAIMTLAVYHERKSEFEKAAFLYERATKNRDLDVSAEAYLAYAQMRVGQKMYDKALPLLRSYLDLKRNTRVERYLESVERAAAQAAASNAGA